MAQERTVDWPCKGRLSVRSISTAEKEITWDISNFLKGCLGKDKTVNSSTFVFNNASLTLIIMTKASGRTHFGIDFSREKFSNEEINFYCDISLQSLDSTVIKKCELMLKQADSSKEMNGVFYLSLRRKIIQEIGVIICRISKERSSMLEGRAETDKNKEIPMVHLENKVCQDFKNLLLSEEGSDVTIQVEDRQFKVHRSVLTARSSVFASMFRHEMKEKATGVVKVKDCEPSSFPVLLEYIYYGSTKNLTVENVFNLYSSADKYDLPDLRRKCLEFIQNNLSVDMFCETITLAFQHSEADLLNFAVDFFSKNFKKIIITTKWQAFNSENPIQCNEICIKAFTSGPQDE